MNQLMIKLDRLLIGDSLVAPTGYAIDYIDPSGGVFHEPCYALRLGRRILFMTKNEEDDDHQDLQNFIDNFNWRDADLQHPGDVWRLDPSGSAENPMWDHPIGQLTMKNHRWLFNASPHTGRRKTIDWIPQRNNHAPAWNVEKNEIKGVRAFFFHDGSTNDNDLYMIGRVYAVVERLGKSTTPTVGFIQLESIQEKKVGAISRRDLSAMGFDQFEQLRSALGSVCKNPHRMYWVFGYHVVHTDLVAQRLETTEPTDVTADMPMQLSLKLEALA